MKAANCTLVCMLPLLWSAWMPSVTNLELPLPWLPPQWQVAPWATIFFPPSFAFLRDPCRGQRTGTTASEPHFLPRLAQVRLLLPVSEFLGTFLFTPYAPVMAGYWEVINVLTSCRHYARQIPPIYCSHLSMAAFFFPSVSSLICSWRMLLVFHLFSLLSPIS